MSEREPAKQVESHGLAEPMHITDRDIVALGGSLTPETMIEAYRQGIFPWPVEDFPVLPWFCPEQRAILEFSRIHIPRSLARELKKHSYHFSIDQAFDCVVEYCADVVRPDDGTWITPEMISACKILHRLGHAHSVEVWQTVEGRDFLVGGMYGIEVDGYFSGESMFHLRPNTSKLALLHLAEHLKSRGLDWIDIQVLTPHMQKLGAEIITRDQFLAKLAQTRRAHQTREIRDQRLFDQVTSK